MKLLLQSTPKVLLQQRLNSKYNRSNHVAIGTFYFPTNLALSFAYCCSKLYHNRVYDFVSPTAKSIVKSEKSTKYYQQFIYLSVCVKMSTEGISVTFKFLAESQSQ